MSEHSDYYHEMKARYEGLDPKQMLQVLNREMLPHIGILRDSVNHIRSVDTSVTSNLFAGYQGILNALTTRIDQLEDLRAEALADSDLPPAQSISAIHYCIGLPITTIFAFSEITLDMIANRTIPGLPEDYRHWVNNLWKAANNILDLFEVLTGKRVQD